MNIGQKIKKLRLEAELTQQEVAKRLSVKNTTISCYELNKNNPSYQVIHELAELFNVPASYFINDDERFKKTKVTELLNELIKEGIINSADEITEDMEKMIINAAKLDLQMQLMTIK